MSRTDQDPRAGLLTWQISEQASGRELKLWLAAADDEQRRRLYHDYIAAVRTLRYLAQKGLRGQDETVDPVKQAAFDKHLRNLEAMQSLVVDPLFERSEREPGDAP